MQYIWELFYTYKHPKAYLKQPEVFSPYMEISPLSEEHSTSDVIEYNSFYRYEKIFWNMFQKMQGENELRDIFFDVFSRFLIECDLKSGLDMEIIQHRKIINELEKGNYGKHVSELVQEITYEEKYKLAHYIHLARAQGGTTVYLFAKAVISLLNSGAVYRDKEKAGYIILYVGRKKNVRDVRLIELIEELLLPMEIERKLLWEKHFGLIDEQSTMIIDEILML